MGLHSELGRVVLAPRDVFVLDTPDPVVIAVRSGCVWLTQGGDSQDVVLQPGQLLALRRAAEVVITPRGAAELVVTQPAPPAAGNPWRSKAMRLAAALVDKVVTRGVRHGAIRRLASRLHFGPPAQAGMD
ncbi:MAG: DUF2917 domain-containing protein [Aromatoleum sp.]|jgi:hypothetical protein|uniref:DUF2917 domain-containing protein n=1 Tax=Aromatoleum sp. TaxID=2307007 RepID=UPI002893A4C6|nr:DUF2917 domain-containing protein [Aromatoleum sp.]MDT3672739.1 DUF2917 domain-containing protein [Aromatoleum sp.]